jgi:sodium/potassium-transporting ATPase subunit alpha
MSTSILDELAALQTRWAVSGQRVLLLARRVIPSSKLDPKVFESPQAADQILRQHTNDLVVIGMIGILDPPRRDIPEVVRICRGGGIRFFMVSSLKIKLTSGHRRLCENCGSYRTASRDCHCLS